MEHQVSQLPVGVAELELAELLTLLNALHGGVDDLCQEVSGGRPELFGLAAGLDDGGDLFCGDIPHEFRRGRFQGGGDG